MHGFSKELADAVALAIEPTDPGVLDSHPGHVLLDVATGETWSLDPADYRLYDGQSDDELRGAMELAVESAWLDADEKGRKTVLVPACLLSA